METATIDEMQEVLDDLSGGGPSKSVLKQMFKNKFKGVYKDEDQLDAMAEELAESGGGAAGMEMKAYYSSTMASMDSFTELANTFPVTASTALSGCVGMTATMAPGTLQSLNSQLSTIKLTGVNILQNAVLGGVPIPKSFVDALKVISKFKLI